MLWFLPIHSASALQWSGGFSEGGPLSLSCAKGHPHLDLGAPLCPQVREPQGVQFKQVLQSCLQATPNPPSHVSPPHLSVFSHLLLKVSCPTCPSSHPIAARDLSELRASALHSIQNRRPSPDRGAQGQSDPASLSSLLRLWLPHRLTSQKLGDLHVCSSLFKLFSDPRGSSPRSARPYPALCSVLPVLICHAPDYSCARHTVSSAHQDMGPMRIKLSCPGLRVCSRPPHYPPCHICPTRTQAHKDSHVDLAKDG
jgi:hypothetical protein